MPLEANASSDVEDRKSQPSPIKKHFIDVLVEEEPKENMSKGVFKKGLQSLFKKSLTNMVIKTTIKTN